MARRDKSAKRNIWSKKKWYKVKAPKMFDEKVVTETPALKDQNVLDRVIEIPLNELTGSFRHFKTKVYLRVVSVKDGVALTDYFGQELTGDMVSRLVRRWSSRIDLIKDLKTKDDRFIRMKFMVLTTNRVNSSVKSAIRRKLDEEIDSLIPKKTLEQVVDLVNSQKLQKDLISPLSKLYPIRAVEIRRIQMLKKKEIERLLDKLKENKKEEKVERAKEEKNESGDDSEKSKAKEESEKANK